jgi:hypothetical protein
MKRSSVTLNCSLNLAADQHMPFCGFIFGCVPSLLPQFYMVSFGHQKSNTTEVLMLILREMGIA